MVHSSCFIIVVVYILFIAVAFILVCKSFPLILQRKVSHVKRYHQSSLYSLNSNRRGPIAIDHHGDHQPSIQTSFLFLKSLDERCERLSKFENEFLLSFWSDKVQGFQIFPSQNSGISITTTCIALMAILANPGYWKNYAVWDNGNSLSSTSSISSTRSVLSSAKVSLQNVVESIYQSPWRTDDTFQTQILISTLCMFSNYNEDDDKCKKAVELMLDRDGSRYVRHRDQDSISSYLRHQYVVALLALVDNDGVPNGILILAYLSTINGDDISADHHSSIHRLVCMSMIGDKSTAQVAIALERSNMVAFDDLCRYCNTYQ